MEVILLERVARLGNVGDVVAVRGGYGRNFLVPQGKALRATKESLKQFEAQRSVLEKRNSEAKSAAETKAKEFAGLSVKIVRQAAEDGKLYGSVGARDIETALVEAGHSIERRHIDLAATIKNLGLYTAFINLHPEVRVECKVEVVRTLESSAYDAMAEEEQASTAAPQDADEGDEDAA